MKQFITVIAISALATVSLAQFGQNDNRRQDRNDRGQFGRRENMEAYRVAIEEINKGQRSLTSALPVYRGRRNTAFRLSEHAERELWTGWANERSSDRRPQRELKDNVLLDNYSKDQVRRSNEKLRDASENFEDAIKFLSRSNWNSSANQRTAINDLRRAVDEIKKAIESTKDFLRRGRDWDRDNDRDRGDWRGRDNRRGSGR
ncbi:MAG TPA: hypothetical protein VK171_07965 [Fimbriimonas sp.]|nr:hypothetical protein [Fimbriimonas sp.]